MYYPIYKNAVINSYVTCHPYISASNSTKFYLYDRNVDHINPVIIKKFNGGAFAYEGANTNNLTCSLVKTNYNTTTNNSTYGVIKNLCNLYQAHSYDYHNTENYTTFTVLELSNQVFGSTITKGSFVLDDNTAGIHYYDNGLGSIYTGTTRVGKIFYNEGLFVITASSNVTSLGNSTNYGIGLSGSVAITSVNINLNIPKGTAICSTNNTYYVTGSNTQVRTRRLDKQEVYFSSVYLYDDRRNLVGIAKINQPIKKDINDSYIIRLKYNY